MAAEHQNPEAKTPKPGRSEVQPEPATEPSPPDDDEPRTWVVPGSIGDLSRRAGIDVREMFIDGKDVGDVYALIKKRERLGLVREPDPAPEQDSPHGRSD